MLQLLLKAAKISFITLWTPPRRLVHQCYKRELNDIQKPRFSFHGAQLTILFFILHFLPRRLTTWSIGPLLHTKLGKRLLSHPSRHFLRKHFAFYGQPKEVVQCYRHWLQFCTPYISKTLNNFIVEFDTKLKFYSHEQWGNMVQEYML